MQKRAVAPGRLLLARMIALVVACAFAAGLPGPAQAQRMAHLPAVAPVLSCADLARTDLAAATGATATLSAAAVDGQCVVTGTIAPAIRFEVRLPLAGWTQRFLQTGCGGLCGNLRINPEKAEGCAPVTDGTIVLASSDMGHQGNAMGWGDDPQKRIDFAHRGVHVTTLAAKALIKAFYGQPQRYAYFSGCSDGGREALMEAERYPEDFDGIAAGAPALNFTVQNSFHHAWLAHANTAADGRAILIADDMVPLHKAVLAACDGLDGAVDGQITDPRRCHVDPAVIQCKGAYKAGECLTAQQVAAVREIYRGAHDAAGVALEVGPLQPGSELEWVGVFVPRSREGRIGSANMALDTVNHLLFTPNRTYSIADFSFTAAFYAEEEVARALYSADNADLSPFAGHGGKLILWHGWSDPHISPLNTIDYYARVGRKLGDAQRDGFVRMFLLPGMGHCGGGDGPSEFPLLAALMAWVEQGDAPQVMVAHRAAPHPFGPPPGMKGPPPGAKGPPADGPPPEMIAEMMRKDAELAKLGPRSRPVYAYPQVAAWDGKGPLDAAGSFHPVTPAPIEGLAQWVGAR